MPGARRIQVDVRDEQVERVRGGCGRAPCPDPGPRRILGPAPRAAPRGSGTSPRRRRRAGCEAWSGMTSWREPAGRELDDEHRARGLLHAETEPPCARTTSRTMARPRPVPWPRGLVVTHGSNRRSMTSGRNAGPVSATSRRMPPAGACAEIDSVPPSGIASSALVTRLSSAISSCVASALIGGRILGHRDSQVEYRERDSRGWATSRTRSMMSASATASKPGRGRA